MDWVSLVLVAVIALLTWRAWRAGFIRELVSFASVILAIPIAGVMYPRMYPKIHRIVTDGDLAALVSFLAILIGVVVGGQVLAHALRKTAAILNLGVADSLAGAVFGFAKGVLLTQAILIALVAFPSPNLKSQIDSSPVAKGLLDTSPIVLAFLPNNFDDQLHDFLDGIRNIANTGSAAGTPTPAP